MKPETAAFLGKSHECLAKADGMLAQCCRDCWAVASYTCAAIADSRPAAFMTTDGSLVFTAPACPAPATHIVPALIAASGDSASLRFLEFFAGTIRNAHARRAYGRAIAAFLTWCEDAGVPSIAAVHPDFS